jgi:DNA-binding NtrC family response regulator
MSGKVLFVDDDPVLLKGLSRQFRKRFDLLIASGGEEALRFLSNREVIAVAVVDMRMPGIDGLELLRLMQKVAPNTIRIMLTGNADQQTAVDAINQGNVFRFYSKPCQYQQLGDGVDAALRQYELERSEHELVEKIVAGNTSVTSTSLLDPTELASEIVSQLAQETHSTNDDGSPLPSSEVMSEDEKLILYPVNQATIDKLWPEGWTDQIDKK